MNEWRDMGLLDLGSVERGRSRHRPRNDPRLLGGDVPFFQTSDVKAATLHLTEPVQTLSELGVAQSRVWPPGVTCITIAANIAESAVLGREGAFPDSVLGFTPSHQAIDAYFVKYLLDFERERLTSISRGTTQDNLSLEKLLARRFRLPEAPGRAAIASVLRDIDELIENNRRRMRLLEEMARAVYREWFVMFRFPDHIDHFLVDSPLGPIPMGWSVGHLTELVEEVRESTPPTDLTAALPYVPIEVMESKVMTLGRSRPGSEAASSLRLFQRGDVLFGAMRAYFHKVCRAPFAGVTRSTCFVLRPRPSYQLFALLALADERTVAYAASHSSGSTIPYAKWAGVLSAMRVVIPPANLIAKFTELVDPLICEAETLAPLSRNLEIVRDALLPRLVSGQIDLSSISLDALTDNVMT